MVLVSGCHYADCHYLDANRSTVRRVDGLWDGLEKAGLRPGRLELEWCSAAEGPRWQTVMEEIENTRSLLAESKVPGPRNPKASDEDSEARFLCMRCGYGWNGYYNRETERTCSECLSNSVRWLKEKK